MMDDEVGLDEFHQIAPPACCFVRQVDARLKTRIRCCCVVQKMLQLGVGHHGRLLRRLACHHYTTTLEEVREIVRVSHFQLFHQGFEILCVTQLC